jgi:hypothetical protein
MAFILLEASNTKSTRVIPDGSFLCPKAGSRKRQLIRTNMDRRSKGILQRYDMWREQIKIPALNYEGRVVEKYNEGM